jgi:hypothetical protein
MVIDVTLDRFLGNKMKNRNSLIINLNMSNIPNQYVPPIGQPYNQPGFSQQGYNQPINQPYNQPGYNQPGLNQPGYPMKGAGKECYGQDCGVNTFGQPNVNRGQSSSSSC